MIELLVLLGSSNGCLVVQVLGCNSSVFLLWILLMPRCPIDVFVVWLFRILWVVLTVLGKLLWSIPLSCSSWVLHQYSCRSPILTPLCIDFLCWMLLECVQFDEYAWSPSRCESWCRCCAFSLCSMWYIVLCQHFVLLILLPDVASSCVLVVFHPSSESVF